MFGKVRPARTDSSPTMDTIQILLGLIEQGLSVEEMAPHLQVASPNQPEYFSAWKAECLLQMDADILRATVGGTSRGFDDPAQILADIKVPVLLLQADPDAGGILPDDYIAGLIPDNETFTMKKIIGAGHNINRDFPELMLPIVLPWLAEYA